MTDEQAQAFRDAEDAARTGTVRLIETVLERVGMQAGAKAVFGDPIERDGRTVIPVAQMIIGSGAGSGFSDETGEGDGAGGGALTRPLGYIELSGEQATFVPLKQPWQDPVLVLAYSTLALIAARTLVKLIRG